MLAKILIIVVAAYVAFEVIEHLIIPLLGKIIWKEKRSLIGPESMIGKVGRVREWRKKAGKVEVGAEIWNAVSDYSLSSGDKVIIEEVNGLIVKVKFILE